MSSIPRFREELQLLKSSCLSDGSPTWMLHDPVCNRYFRLGWLEFELLSRWQLGKIEQIIAAVNSETTLHVEERQIDSLREFLAANQLLDSKNHQVRSQLKARLNPNGRLPLLTLFQQIFFIRIPLFKPDNFLDKTYPLVRGLFSNSALWSLAFIGVLGVLLVLRQWDGYLNGFNYFFTLQGVLLFAATLLISKTVHELGHVYTAKKFGVPVPVMGVALLFFWPMLYSDTTAVWRLPERRSRLLISAAGILAELALAAVATLAWSFLPDGPLRSACFFVSATGWLLSVFINLNPFMRFDGYYILADWLGQSNLQPSAFAFGRWFARKQLLGWHTPAPESVNGIKMAIMIIYAYATWVYRLFIFSAIALLAYHFLFKVLGLMVFFLEIIWLIIRPLQHELNLWLKNQRHFGANGNFLVTAGLLILLLSFLLVPHKQTLHAPALLRARTSVQIFAPHPARLAKIAVATGSTVAAGDLLFTLTDPKLNHEIIQAKSRVAMLENQLKRQATKANSKGQLHILESKLAKAITKLNGWQKLAVKLSVVAPISGRIVEFADYLRPGLWVDGKQLLARIIDPDHSTIEAYPDEQTIAAIKPGQLATFYPEIPENPPVVGTVFMVDLTETHTLDSPYLASRFGGRIAVESGGNGKWSSRDSRFRILLQLKQPPPEWVQRGEIFWQGADYIIISKIWQRIVAVLVRESGF